MSTWETGNTMFKFIFVLCIITIVAFGSQLLYLHQDTALSWHAIKSDPEWVLWGVLVLASPVLFFSYMILQWLFRKRAEKKAMQGNHRAYTQRNYSK